MKHVNPKDLTVALPESDTVRVMREARALVSKGWCQKVAKVTCFVSGQTSYCMTSALSAAAEELLGRIYAPDSAYHALFEITLDNIHEWNDAPERTLEEVLDAFDSAIAIVQHWESLG